MKIKWERQSSGLWFLMYGDRGQRQQRDAGTGCVDVGAVVGLDQQTSYDTPFVEGSADPVEG